MSTSPLGFTEQMPEYLCHKKVRGLKIKSIEREDVLLGTEVVGYNHKLTFEDKDFPPFVVTDQFVKRSHCKVGGYLVRYEDGYLSWSPAEAFENGYSRTGSVDKPLTIAELNKIGEQAMNGYPETKYNPNHTAEKQP